MPVTSTSSAQSAASGLWAQIQQQQAQRNANQAEQQARGLQARAQAAQSVADRAQESARSLKVQSNQAQGEASQAQRSLVTLSSVGEVHTQLSDLHEQISKVLQPETTANSSASLAPVVNAFGEPTGTLVNVTA